MLARRMPYPAAPSALGFSCNPREREEIDLLTSRFETWRAMHEDRDVLSKRSPAGTARVRWGWVGLRAAVILVVAAVALGIVAHFRTIPEEVASIDGCYSPAPRLSLLMIGNSFTQENDLGRMVADVLCRSGLATNVHIDELTRGGAALAQWDNAGTKARIAKHDAVVLQDQSQIPGLDPANASYRASLKAVRDLTSSATAANARVVLFETWGYRTGEQSEDGFTSTFDDMQEGLIEGYAAYLAEAKAVPHADSVAVAHVGTAWERVNDEFPSDFDQLYASDGQHPSKAGSYLAALVLAVTVARTELPTFVWSPPDLSLTIASHLQTAVREGGSN